MTGGRHEHMRAWEAWEDEIIDTMVAATGNKWSEIVDQLPGRTVSSVRNRWQRIQKGRERARLQPDNGNICLRCGQRKMGHTCRAPDVVVQQQPPLRLVRVKRPRSPELPLFEGGWASAESSLPPCDAKIPMTCLSVRAPPGDICAEVDSGEDGKVAAADVAEGAPEAAWADVLPDAEASEMELGEVEAELEKALDAKAIEGTPNLQPKHAADSAPDSATPPPQAAVSFSLPQRPPEPPPPLVSRSYSTAQSILANLAEPGTAEALSRSMSVSNVLLNAREEVVDSMATYLKGLEPTENDENIVAALGLVKAQPSANGFHFSFGAVDAIPSPWA